MFKNFLENKKLLSDIILIAVLLVISLSAFLIFYIGRVEGSYVEVSVDNEVVATYSLSINGVYHINNGTNILVIEDGKAYLEYSKCPDQTCVFGKSIHGNKIHYVNQIIVCAPNRVQIKIIGEEEGIDF